MSVKFLGAAKIGILQMLQEEWLHPLTTQMSLYSCYHYLKNPLSWTEIEDEVPKVTPKEVFDYHCSFRCDKFTEIFINGWKRKIRSQIKKKFLGSRTKVKQNFISVIM